jgi:hypothetical protein
MTVATSGLPQSRTHAGDAMKKNGMTLDALESAVG